MNIINLCNLFDIESGSAHINTEPMDEFPEAVRYNDYYNIYQEKKTFLCQIGQNKVKRLLAKKQTEGDEIAGLYRSVLITESCFAYYCMYISSRRYGQRYYNDYIANVEKLIESCNEYIRHHPDVPISFGYKPWKYWGMNYLLLFDIPGMRQVVFYAELGLAELQRLKIYEYEWDGIVNGNYDKLDAAVMNRYADDVKNKHSQTILARRKISCVSSNGLLADYSIMQILESLNAQDISGHDITMSDVYQSLIAPSALQAKNSYNLSEGLFVVHIQNIAGMTTSQSDYMLQNIHQTLLKYDWYIWTSWNLVEKRTDVIAYVSPIYYTKAESKANVAVIYSKIMIALSDYLHMSCEDILVLKIISIDKVFSHCGNSIVMLNGGFHPNRLLPHSHFESSDDYVNYVYNRSGQVSSYYMEYFDEFNAPRVATTQGDDDSIDQWIAEVTSRLIEEKCPLRVATTQDDDDSIDQWIAEVTGQPILEKCPTRVVAEYSFETGHCRVNANVSPQISDTCFTYFVKIKMNVTLKHMIAAIDIDLMVNDWELYRQGPTVTPMSYGQKGENRRGPPALAWETSILFLVKCNHIISYCSRVG